jgi:hypothetical protein
MIAVESIGSISAPANRSAISVAVDPRLDRADVVVVEDLDYLRLLDARHALRGLGVVDEDHPPWARGDEVAARQQPDRAVARVDRDRGLVVDVFDLLGDVCDQVVGIDRERLAVCHPLAG